MLKIETNVSFTFLIFPISSQFENSIKPAVLVGMFCSSSYSCTVLTLISYWLCWRWMAGSSIMWVGIIVSFCWNYSKTEVSHLHWKVNWFVI